MKIGTCEPAHVPAVLRLLSGWNGDAERLQGLAADFERIYFHHPWPERRLASLVCEIDGRIVGFLGVTPRSLRLGDRELLAAVCSNFRVADDAPPAQRPFIAARLVRTALAGPQDLSFADGANALSRRIWEGLGGIAAPLYSLDWMALLRPTRAVLELARFDQTHRRSVATIARGVARTLDGALARFLGAEVRAAARSEPADIADLDAVVPLPADRLVALRAPAARRWVVETARRLAFDGDIRVRRVLGSGGKTIGGYVLVRRNPVTADLLEIGAAGGEPSELLAVLLRDAFEMGLALVRGHTDPAYFQAYRDHNCLLNTGRWTIAHAANPSLLAPFREGRAALSALDGERWIGSFDLPPEGHQPPPSRASR